MKLFQDKENIFINLKEEYIKNNCINSVMRIAIAGIALILIGILLIWIIPEPKQNGIQIAGFVANTYNTGKVNHITLSPSPSIGIISYEEIPKGKNITALAHFEGYKYRAQIVIDKWYGE